MRKMAIVVVHGLLATGLLTGCGKKDETASSTPSQSEATPTEQAQSPAAPAATETKDAEDAPPAATAAAPAETQAAPSRPAEVAPVDVWCVNGRDRSLEIRVDGETRLATLAPYEHASIKLTVGEHKLEALAGGEVLDTRQVTIKADTLCIYDPDGSASLGLVAHDYYAAGLQPPAANPQRRPLPHEPFAEVNARAGLDQTMPGLVQIPSGKSSLSLNKLYRIPPTPLPGGMVPVIMAHDKAFLEADRKAAMAALSEGKAGDGAGPYMVQLALTGQREHFALLAKRGDWELLLPQVAAQPRGWKFSLQWVILQDVRGRETISDAQRGVLAALAEAGMMGAWEYLNKPFALDLEGIKRFQAQLADRQDPELRREMVAVWVKNVADQVPSVPYDVALVLCDAKLHGGALTPQVQARLVALVGSDDKVRDAFLDRAKSAPVETRIAMLRWLRPERENSPLSKSQRISLIKYLAKSDDPRDRFYGFYLRYAFEQSKEDKAKDRERLPAVAKGEPDADCQRMMLALLTRDDVSAKLSEFGRKRSDLTAEELAQMVAPLIAVDDIGVSLQMMSGYVSLLEKALPADKRLDLQPYLEKWVLQTETYKDYDVFLKLAKRNVDRLAKTVDPGLLSFLLVSFDAPLDDRALAALVRECLALTQVDDTNFKVYTSLASALQTYEAAHPDQPETYYSTWFRVLELGILRAPGDEKAKLYPQVAHIADATPNTGMVRQAARILEKTPHAIDANAIIEQKRAAPATDPRRPR